jgi:ubiquitin carboxyl-terminal hydrolase 34
MTELRSDSAMRIDSEPPAPATPEKKQQPAGDPASAPRSSRVTINVRTPSQQPLEAIPSSPSSPSPQESDRRSATITGDDEPTESAPKQPEARMAEPEQPYQDFGSQADLSDSGSPPIEVVSVSADEDADFDDDDSITMYDESGRALDFDPSVVFPFHDGAESYLETVIRLLQYLPTHEQVPRAFIEWIDKYLGYIKAASPRAIDESYFSCREMWQPVPQLLLHMVSRK